MNLFVGNLSWDVSQDDLEQTFAAFGQVSSAKVMMDRETGKPRGFAFVDMPNDGEARKAIENLNGKEIQGRQMNVNEARPREARPRGGNDGSRRW